MHSIKILLFLLLIVKVSASEDILIYHTSIPVLSSELKDPTKGPISRDCYYFITMDQASALPSVSPLKEGDFRPPQKAISIAYRDYFKGHGIEAKDYLDMVEARLKKVDDYTLSFVATHLRKQSSSVRNIWFYEIKCTWPMIREYVDELPAILVLMDETVVLPRVVTKGLFEPQPDFVPK